MTENNSVNKNSNEIKSENIDKEETVIDIPNNSNNTENKSTKEDKKHVSFFKQFLLPKVYYTALCAALGMWAVSIISTIFLSIIGKIDSKNSNEEALDDMAEENEVALNLYVCIFAPIIEEFIFRRLIFYFIKKFTLKSIAYIVSSFLFSFAHFGLSISTLISEIWYFPVYFFMGCVLAYAYDYDGYILSSIFGHMLYNSSVTLLQYLF